MIINRLQLKPGRNYDKTFKIYFLSQFYLLAMLQSQLLQFTVFTITDLENKNQQLTFNFIKFLQKENRLYKFCLHF
ncbi:MAG: hypothetical protein C4322_15190 [Mastigocladus sp. ERB_26_1]